MHRARLSAFSTGLRGNDAAGWRSDSDRHCANACDITDRSSSSAGATGVWYIDKRSSQRRRDRQVGRFAISASLRTSLVNIPDANNSCGARARTQTGRAVPNSASTPAAFFISRARANNCGMPACPARRMEGGLASSNAESRAEADARGRTPAGPAVAICGCATPASARSGCGGSSARVRPCPRYTPRRPSAPPAPSPARPP